MACCLLAEVPFEDGWSVRAMSAVHGLLVYGQPALVCVECVDMSAEHAEEIAQVRGATRTLAPYYVQKAAHEARHR